MPGEATGHYNPTSGEIEVSVNGVVNWYVEHVGYASMTGAPPSGLPGAAGLVTDNDTRIGESAFAPFSYDVDLGYVAESGIIPSSFYIFWNESLGSPLRSRNFCGLCPEPTTIAMTMIAACGLLARRRRPTS